MSKNTSIRKKFGKESHLNVKNSKTPKFNLDYDIFDK